MTSVGVDVGGTTTAAALVDAAGTVLDHVQAPTHAHGPGTALAGLAELIERLLDAARARGIVVGGLGVGVPGPVDAEAGVVGGDVLHVPELAHQPLGPALAARFGLPAFVDNDVNVLALGEWTWGAGRGVRSLALLALGTGVGGGLVLEGTVVRGRAGYGGELGHVPIDYDGRPCVCGGRGCLKAYVSGTDIAREASARLGRPVTAPEAFRLADGGDPVAARLIDEVTEALGAGLAVIVNGLNPDCVLVAGGVARALAPRADRVRQAVGRFAFARALAATRLEILAADKAGGARGGAALVAYETRRRAAAP